MMPTTIKQIEGAPVDYADPPDGLSTDAAALEPALIWQRLEVYIAHRYSERDVEWIVEGCGEWQPPLTPATIATTEVWAGEAWDTVELRPSPLGYVLPGVGPYRFTGTAGVNGTEPPALVLEAYRRLAEFMAAVSFQDVGLRSENVPNVWQGEYGSPSWRARALQDSGAADLLRGYRRA